MARLTERQAAFARHLITGMSATEAARKAGYSATYADRQAKQLLENPQVAERLRQLRDKVDDGSIMTARETLQRLTSIARGEGRIERSTPAGIFELPPDWSDRQRALSELAKHHGLLTERHEVTLRKAPGDMTDAELQQALQDAGLL